MASKDLVYYVIGGAAKYADLLKFSLETLRGYAENRKYDILVICDESYKLNIVDLPQVHIHVCEPNADHIKASMRKLEVFSWPKISDYARALYLDCDIVVCGSLDPLFNMISNPDILYVVNETFGWCSYYECKDTPYSKSDLEAFQKLNILPFNAGQFAFSLSPNMRSHFEAICKRMSLGYDANLHFYEQSFMNDYFNRRGITNSKPDNKLGTYVTLFAQYLQKPSGAILAHFCDAGMPSEQKLENMRKYKMQQQPQAPTPRPTKYIL